jgi:phosphoribosylanthranilate isomerase
VRTRIKFCGMTRAEDVRLACDLGVDAVGLIFAARSPRRLDPSQARALRSQLPPFVAVVALFMDNAIAEIQTIVQIVKPTLLQFHGEETPQDCAGFGLPYLKAVPMGAAADTFDYAARYTQAAGFVLDSHAAGEAGGSGRRFDWGTIPRDFTRPLLLAGGLTPDNVYDAVRTVRPYAVDVSSGIESAPGIKDAQRMRRFVAQVRRADDSD